VADPAQHPEPGRVADDLSRVEELLREWDPIGVIHVEVPQSWDEYDSYAPEVLRMLANGCNAEMLAAHLEDCRTRRMGLHEDPGADLAAATRFVEWWTTAHSQSQSPRAV
jgi:hypothetical protein